VRNCAMVGILPADIDDWGDLLPVHNAYIAEVLASIAIDSDIASTSAGSNNI
jgi:hypothetical protein